VELGHRVIDQAQHLGVGAPVVTLADEVAEHGRRAVPGFPSA
jgi:hypothetical protein